MIYHIQLNAAIGPKLNFMGVELDTTSVASWAGAGALLVVGVALVEWARRRFAKAWGHAQEEIEVEIKRRETA
jgi:branched-chain amino acid transport system permease protein